MYKRLWWIICALALTAAGCGDTVNKTYVNTGKSEDGNQSSIDAKKSITLKVTESSQTFSIAATVKQLGGPEQGIESGSITFSPMDLMGVCYYSQRIIDEYEEGCADFQSGQATLFGMPNNDAAEYWFLLNDGRRFRWLPQGSSIEATGYWAVQDGILSWGFHPDYESKYVHRATAQVWLASDNNAALELNFGSNMAIFGAAYTDPGMISKIALVDESGKQYEGHWGVNPSGDFTAQFYTLPRIGKTQLAFWFTWDDPSVVKGTAMLSEDFWTINWSFPSSEYNIFMDEDGYLVWRPTAENYTLRANVVSATKAEIFWSPDHPKGGYVKVMLDNADIGHVSGAFIPITDLEPNSEHTVSVSVYNADGEEVGSAVQFFATPSTPTTPDPIVVTSITSDHIFLKWSEMYPNRDRAVKYHVGIKGGDIDSFTSADNNSTYPAFSNLDADTGYQFIVYALDAYTDELLATSQTYTFTTLPAP